MCLLRHSLSVRNQNAVGKVEDGHSVGGRGRKRGLARNVRVAWGCLFCNGEDACQLYAKGHPIQARAHVMLWSVEGRKENKMQQASFDLHHTASYRPSLPSRVPFFTSKTSPNHDEKGHPPNLCSQNLRRGQRDATAKPRKPF